ncbi:MAG: SDR family NAD(P)-dependent oxidoreductase [bacterium]
MINNETALVCGGSGLWGKKLCLSLMRKGYKVIALSRKPPRELTEWAEAQEMDFEHINFDLLNPNWQIIEKLTEIDVYFHSASIFDENFEKMLKVNVLSSIQLMELILEKMQKQKKGRLGVLLGQNGRVGLAKLGDFSATQAALWTWAEAKYRELKAKKELDLSLTMIFPNRAPSKLQTQLAEALQKKVKVTVPKNADKLVEATLKSKKSAGRKPILAAINTLLT